MSDVILVTGGAGFIGSHTCLELLATGHELVVIDNFSNSSPKALERVQALCGKTLTVERADLRDRDALGALFSKYRVYAVIHFAGLKAVGESVASPLRYYDNNVVGSVRLFDAMREAGVFRLVFSSSATVYGAPEAVPILESAKLQPANPYGRTKVMIEDILRDLAAADERWRIALLRYFNPVGAHESGRIGEDPKGIPNNVMPYMMQVACGRRDRLQVFGNDYPTPDGTGVRDYIHVVDLALGHLAALRRIDELRGAVAINLGSGSGYSVLELVAGVEAAIGRPLPHAIGPRRPGDVATTIASAALAKQLLGWQTERDLQAICRDSWRWQSSNPNGYDG